MPCNTCGKKMAYCDCFKTRGTSVAIAKSEMSEQAENGRQSRKIMASSRNKGHHKRKSKPRAFQ